MSDEIINTIGWHTYIIIPNEHFVDIEFYEVQSKREEIDELEWVGEDKLASNLDEAKIIGKGRVKWDECSNWDFMPNETYLHFCTINQMRQFHMTVRSAYRIANKIMDNSE